MTKKELFNALTAENKERVSAENLAKLKKLANAVSICWERAAVTTDAAIRASIQSDCKAYERRILEIINK